MRLLHSAKDTSAQFDDPNLVSWAGLVPVMRLAQHCDLAGLVAEHLKMTVAVGVNAHLKIPGIVAGMLAGADSIDDLDVLRHGGMNTLFGGVRAPSTLGSFLRGFDWGNVRQLEVVSRRLLAGLAAGTPVLADAGVLAHLDIDSTQRRVYGHAKAGAGFGAAKVGGYTLRLRGLNPLLAAVSTPTCAPVLAGTRLRGGTANSARGAESFVAEAITTAHGAGPRAADRPDELRVLQGAPIGPPPRTPPNSNPRNTSSRGTRPPPCLRPGRRRARRRRRRGSGAGPHRLNQPSTGARPGCTVAMVRTRAP
jgi:hypothetical protein